MATVRVEAQISTEQLLRAVEHLPSQDFDAFLTRMLALRAIRDAPHIAADQSALVIKINQVLPAILNQRYQDLVAKRQAETLTSVEHTELLQISDQIEQHDVARMEALVTLAQLRQTTISALMQTLGISSPSCV